jgi:SAM-dependent methyltransferase
VSRKTHPFLTTEYARTMEGYYSTTLSAERLKRCYDIAPERTRQYLESEIQYVLSHVDPRASVLELGCGYGRLLSRLAERCHMLVGIDTSYDSLRMAVGMLSNYGTIHLFQMDAGRLGLSSKSFDVTVCIQNGISAFRLDPLLLVSEAIRVTKPGGLCLFSSYSDKFWDARLEWFRIQSDERLLGDIDWDLTKEGEIVCKDGFRATTYRPDDFKRIAEALGVRMTLAEIDGSSLFCSIHVEE